MSTVHHHFSRPDLARRGRVTFIAGLAALLAAGCRDSVSPLERMAPTAPTPVLTSTTSIDLLAGQPEGTRADVRGINDAGQATGSRFLLSVNDWRPYRWTPGAGFEAISVFPGTAWGNDINNAGVVVGRMQVAIDKGDRAFVAVAGAGVNLGALPGVNVETASSEAVAINEAGEIVGWSHTIAGPRHAVFWSAAYVIHDLGTLGGAQSAAVDINASGQVIGMSEVSGGGQHGFLWTSGGGMQDLVALLGYPASSVAAINDAGQIAGSYAAPNGETHAFLYTPGSGLRDLGTLGGDSSMATGLNAQGQVVGNSKSASGDWHAFLWTPEDGMEDVTVISGFTGVRKLNDDLQTLTGGLFPQPTHPYIVTLVVQPAWPFTGFANPIKDPPEWNRLKAGHTAKLRFGLGGDRGLDIFAAGSPSSVEVSCATGETIGTPTTVSPSDLELRYQAGPDRYTLRWRTSHAWGGSCRRLALELDDGSTHVALFSFR